MGIGRPSQEGDEPLRIARLRLGVGVERGQDERDAPELVPRRIDVAQARGELVEFLPPELQARVDEKPHVGRRVAHPLVDDREGRLQRSFVGLEEDVLAYATVLGRAVGPRT